MSPRSALVVAFLLLHSVSKCKKCLKQLIYLVEVSGKIFIFFEYFSISRESKYIYLRYLKTFSKVLNMFLSLLGAKSCLGICL
jgi:hypothetical protein